MRCARAAPSTSPIPNAPAMPIAETFSVLSSPSTNSERCSQRKCQSMLARIVIAETGAAASRAAAPLQRLGGGAVRRRVAVHRVAEALAGPRDVRGEVVDERLRRILLQRDLEEEVPGLEAAQRRIDPGPRHGVALADADPPRDREELVLGQSQVAILRGDAEQECVVEHE